MARGEDEVKDLWPEAHRFSDNLSELADGRVSSFWSLHALSSPLFRSALLDLIAFL